VCGFHSMTANYPMFLSGRGEPSAQELLSARRHVISRIFKRLFSGLATPGDTVPGIRLGAFGKHPSFDDHLDDPGLSSPALVDARRILYADAIRANIDSGAWERLEPGQRLSQFDHTFLWSLSKRDEILIVGRMLPSKDAKGRDKYPLVLCAELRGPTALGATPATIERLEVLAGQCVEASTRSDFGAALNTARAEFPSVLLQPSLAPPVRELVEGFNAAGNDAIECFARCLYAVQRELAPIADRQTATGTGHVRLPLPPGMEDAAALTAWLAVIHRWLPELRGVLLVKPRGQPWVDALVPIPLPVQLECIRKGTSLVPLACDVPYNLDPQIIQRAHELARLLTT
jgi:hypothetical protein